MPQRISVTDVYDQNLNFLIGAGASAGLLPTLSLGIQKDAEARFTVESLATQLEGDPRQQLLLMHYYITCVRPAQVLDYVVAASDPTKKTVLENYKSFLGTLLRILQHRRSGFRRCNVYTTNYDGCFQHAAEEILRDADIDFIVNDGTRGFQRKVLHAKNFSSHIYDSGLFQRHQVSIPQVNLMHLHGSVYWSRDGSNILVDYNRTHRPAIVSDTVAAALEPFSSTLLREDAAFSDLEDVAVIDTTARGDFQAAFEHLPIVNPTKWKFKETLFDEHYYHMLRTLSYELEKPASVLITFGFSFADEHILSLVKRSLSNPTLQVFVCCHSHAELERLKAEFRQFRNVAVIGPESGGKIDFSSFNNDVFSIAEPGHLVEADISPQDAG